MKYEELLKTQRECPFCILQPSDVIAENATMALTYSRAPYIADHMLIVSKRHLESFFEMTDAERADMLSLQVVGVSILKNLGCDVFSFLFREGVETGKSIPHIHLHIVPKMPLEGNYGGATRHVLSAEEISAIVMRLRNAL